MKKMMEKNFEQFTENIEMRYNISIFKNKEIVVRNNYFLKNNTINKNLNSKNKNVAYNLNDNFRALALEMKADVTKVANNFQEYMDGWSGYTQMLSDLQEKYELSDTPKLSDLDRKVWTYEHFMGTGQFSAGIEDRLEATAKAMMSGGSETAASGRYNGAVVNSVYADFTNRNKAFFSLKAFYPDVLSDAQYQRGVDEYVITDQDSLNTKISEYINNPDNSLEEKLYLVSQMNTLQETFLDFNADAITSNITDTLVKNLVAAIYNDTLNVDIYNTDGNYSNNSLILGNDTDEVIEVNSSNSTILAGKGDDKIIGSTSNDTYIYRAGDGADTIADRGGNDTLNFSDISLNEVIIKSDGNDLIIAVKEDGKTFDELTNKVTISNWIDADNRIENITFADGATPNFSEIINTHFISEANDNIDLTNSNDTVNMLSGDDIVSALAGDDTIDAGAGNDTINAGSGNDTLIGSIGDDTLYGGSGNDTYIFNLGDGTDTILDSSGNDTLKFGNGITSDNLAAKIDGTNLIIAIKEDGKTFDELTDKITINNYTNNNNKIEIISLANGDIVNLDSIQATTAGDDVLVYGDNGVTVDAGAGNDTVTTGSGADNIAGGEGNDILNSGAGDDTIDAGAGDDYVNAGSGNDTITGATGADTLVGGLGNDTYIFNLGDGKDTIIDSYTYGYKNSSSKDAGNDTIIFGDGITKEDIKVTLVGSDIVVSINENDSITIKNATHSNFAVENIQLSDGTILKIEDMQEATEGNDSLVFGNSDITLDALGGDDNITTGSGDDTIDGGSGNDVISSGDGDDNILGGLDADTLIAGRGNDTLTGGKGNDNLQGGLGNDTYVFNRGDGQDTITDSYRYGSAGNDTLKFGEGISKDDLIAVASGNDMIIALREDGKTFSELSDKVTVKNWLNVNNRVENIQLSDGSSVSFTEIQGATDANDYLTFGDEGVSVDALGGDDVVITGSGADTINAGSGNDSITSNAGNDTINGGEGNDTLNSGAGNDTLYGDAGNDTLKAGAGDDTLSGGSGVDRLEGSSGNDTYVFGRGDGLDSVIDTSGNDTLQLGDGLSQTDLIIKAQGNDLVVALKEDGVDFNDLSDKITLTNWLSLNTRVENILLNDGTAINLADIQKGTNADDYLIFGDEGVNVTLLDGDDIVISGSGNDTIDGGTGNDTINSNGGNDTLNAGSGDDIVNSGNGHDIIDAGDGADSVDAGLGNDTITGGTGADTLKGGLGDDTYIFNIGDGVDTITDIGGSDVLRFGEGVTKDDISARRDGLDLIVAINDSDKITLNDWFKSSNNIETFEFSDNSTWSKSEIAEMFVEEGLPGVLYSRLGAIMSGGSGDDTYVYNKGDYAVAINDSYFQGDIELQAGNDTLQLSGGINRTDVTFGTHGNDLIIKIEGEHNTYDELKDYVVIRDWKNEKRGIETIIFSDGEELKINKDEAFEPINFSDSWIKGNYLLDGDDGDTLSGNSNDNLIEGNGGDDTIYGNAGADTIKGGAGDDTIIADSETNPYGTNAPYNDILEGGTGNDTLQGGAGDDTYIFNRGDGVDTIHDYDSYRSTTTSYNAGNDTLQFGEGISATDLVFTTEGNNLIVGIKEEGVAFSDLADKITITNWYNTNNKIENFKFRDGTELGTENIIMLGSQGDDSITGINYGDNTITAGAGNDTVSGSANNDIIYGGADNDTISGNGGNDIIDGGTGNDTLYGNAGADTIKGGAGDDTIIADSETNPYGTNAPYNDILEGGTGNDTLQGGAGDDTYIFNRGDGVDTIHDYDSYRSTTTRL
ncbi:calcium-binding protein [Sulfurimonas sp.]|uniref:beta strand repeat-containing protein n=1 Tax=Sulfurimonas sp. TaxID=2022749 RepID=UPI002AB29D26|nr:calcium-binding protein [Sulfurimonas sp.]